MHAHALHENVRISFLYTRSDLGWPHWYLAQELATDRAGYLYHGTIQVGIQTS